jgi:hypothetical protein
MALVEKMLKFDARLAELTQWRGSRSAKG